MNEYVILLSFCLFVLSSPNGLFLFYYIIIIPQNSVCFLVSNRERVGLNGRGSEEGLRGVQGRKLYSGHTI